MLQYFLKMVVVYMLANNVTAWVAVSIPVVLEFSKMLSRGFKKLINIAINTNYKKYHLTYLLVISLIFLIISQSHNIIIIYLFTILLGFLSGINDSCVTRIDTSNKKYESYCLIEEERSSVIGATIGDPIWGAIISSYSENDRRKYTFINNIYFVVRAITSFISIFVCRYFIIKGIESFKYLAVELLIFVAIIYLIANKVNKKIFGRGI